jgi:hypothetical protein
MLPSYILNRVKASLDFRGKYSDSELNNQIEAMTKAEIMDKYFDSFEEKIDLSEIYRFSQSIFHFDLENRLVISNELEKDTGLLPSPGAIFDSFLNQEEKKITGAEIRSIINQIFGINLDAISSLEGSRISLYSKDQWVLQHDNDLFVVHTGKDDIDVRIYPTKYFTEQTGLEMLPNDLQHSLSNMGFYYDKKIKSYYYRNPAEDAVSDAFKGQTMGTIMSIIKQSYFSL